METGTAFAYAIDKLRDAGRFFVDQSGKVFCLAAGSCENILPHRFDLVVKCTGQKTVKHACNQESDEKWLKLIPPVSFQSGISPRNTSRKMNMLKLPLVVYIRLRKMLLNETHRKRASKIA